jgi:hypothetical protein
MKENMKPVSSLVLDGDGVGYGFRAVDGGCEITEIRYPVSDGPEVLKIPASLAGRPVLAIGAHAFWNEERVLGPDRIVLPDTVKEIGDYAFAQGSMTEILLPRGLARIGESAFEECRELERIDLPRTVTEIGGSAFAACISLRAIEVEEGNPAFSSIDGNLYTKDGTALLHYAAQCPLTSLTVPSGTAELPAFAFYGCEHLTEVILPQGITEIPLYAFCGCHSLVSVVLPEGIVDIGASAFEGCLSLRSVTLPSTLREIARAAFWGCRALGEIALPPSLAGIGRAAFRWCTSLSSVVLPACLLRLGEDAFFGCDALSVYAAAPERPSGWSPDWNPEGRPVVWGYTE